MTSARYHLWLKPSGTVRDALAQTIRELALEFGGPIFEPHVTLLGNLIGTEDEHIQRTRTAAANLCPIKIILSKPACGAQYFQCVFMRAEPTPPLMNTNALVKQIFGKNGEPYMPHLSLLYGLYPESQKMAIIHKLPLNVKTTFEATAFFLIRTESDDPKDWREIATCPFTH